MEIGTTKDGLLLKFFRDKVGNASFAYWKSGEGFKSEGEISLKQLKKIHIWIGRLIQYLERP